MVNADPDPDFYLMLFGSEGANRVEKGSRMQPRKKRIGEQRRRIQRVGLGTRIYGDRFLGSLKGLQIRALLCREKNFNSSRSPRQRVNLQFYNVRMKLVTNRLARSCLAFT
jgi:hypothetical protein